MLSWSLRQNHPELLDRAVWRRFQLRLDLPAPSLSLAEEWICRFEKRLGENLGYKPATIAKRLRGLSFSELEQFSLDVQRQYVLTLLESDVRAIVAERLKQWKSRLLSTNTKPTRPGTRDA